MGLTAFSLLLRRLMLALALLSTLACAHATESAAINAALLAPLVDGDTDAKLQVIAQLGQIPDQQAARILEALGQGRLYATPDGRIIALDDKNQATDGVSGAALQLPADADNVMVNNRMRRAIAGALALTQLLSNDTGQRLAAAKRLQQGGDISTLPVIDQALLGEKDAQVREALSIAQASLQLKSTDAAARMQAVAALGATGSGAFRPMLSSLL